MIGIHGIPVGKDKIEVKTINYNPDKLPEASKGKFINVEHLPEEPDYVKGKRNALFINPKTKEMWYEQKDRQINSEEAMSDLAMALASQNAEISAKLDQLITLQTEANNLQKGV